MNTDGSGARPLGVAGCDGPIASPSASSFLCIDGKDRQSLWLYPIQGGSGRKLFELSPGQAFVYARWNTAGDRIFGLTRDRRLLTLDAAAGTLVREETGLAGTGGQDRLIAAALDSEAQTRAYSTIRVSSDLYLASGIR